MGQKTGTRKELLRKANDAFKAGKHEEAEAMYQAILNRYPDDPDTMHALGILYVKREWHGMAAIMFLRAKEYKPLELENYLNLGTAYQREGFSEYAERAFLEGVRVANERMTPIRRSAAYAALGGLYINEGQPEKCIEYTNKAMELMPEQYRGQLEWTHFNLALANLELGNWEIGFKAYHEAVRRKQRQQRNFWTDGSTPVWDGTKGQCVAVYGEQGVGDEVMFSSVLNEFADDCKNVIFECHPRLLPIMGRSFPDIECYGTRKMQERELPQPEDIQAAIPIGSLPMFYRKKDSDFIKHDGYLKADPEKTKFYRERLETLGPGPYIGIAWGGGSKRTRFDLRSIDLDKWAPIIEQKATFVSVHYMDYAAEDAARFRIPHWPKAIDDLDEQFALINACDLIISVNQSLVHFAGSLGKKCWVLTPSKPAWRYGLKGEGMIWYPSARQFRQIEKDWSPVIASVAGTLTEYIGEYNAGHYRRPRPEHDVQAVGAAH